MANLDRPRGLRPAKSLIGAAWNGLIRQYPAADRSSDTTNNHGDIYVGDPIALSSGKAVVANSGDTIIGVCVGVGSATGLNFGDTPQSYFQPDDLTQRYADHAEATGVYIAVVPKESLLFEIQSATDLDLVLGQAADVTTAAGTAHGSRTTGQSTAELATSVNADVTVVEIVDTVDNDSTLANARYLVSIA